MIATADDPERPETPTVTGYSGTGRVFTGPLGSDPREWVEIGTVAAGGVTLDGDQAEPDRPIPLAGQTLTLDIDLDEVDEGLLGLLAGKTRDRWWHRYTKLRYCIPCDKAYRPWLARRHHHRAAGHGRHARTVAGRR